MRVCGEVQSPSAFDIRKYTLDVDQTKGKLTNITFRELLPKRQSALIIHPDSADSACTGDF